MKRFTSLFLTLAILLSGCSGMSVSESTAPTTGSMTAPEVTAPETKLTVPPDTEPAVTEPPATKPAHSEFYLPGVSQEEMIGYFNEVVLATEYAEGSGDPSLVQKWAAPISYRITGDPTEEDIRILETLFAQLNDVEGFPGFIAADDTRPVEDLTISFLDEATFQLAFSDFLQGEYADAAVRYWYNPDTNEMTSARIGYRTDISGDTRTSILLEEVINLLGFNDTTQRPDSILYQYSSENTQLSDIDWVLIRLLYHPDIKCGMNMDACREVLETLYY